MPSQVPSVPQVEAPWSAQAPCGSGASAATAAQRPGELAMLQARQVPQLSLSQQTPSVQEPVMHSVLRTHFDPIGLRLQPPPRQTLGARQSPSLPHEVKQVLPLHWYGAHGSVAPGAHAPLLSQREASMCDEPEQVSWAHMVLAG
jgi:hypothetical protein